MSKDNPGNAVNLLCEGTVIVGDITTKNDIRVDGVIKGKIVTSGRLVVGSTARIEGNIECANIDVQGVVVGDIVVTGTLSLKAPARITGNISYGVMSVEPGVMFNGNCQTLKKDNRGTVKE